MEKIPRSATMTIFVLFFGGSLLDAVVTQNWWRSAFWLLIALVFLGLDRLGQRTNLPR